MGALGQQGKMNEVEGPLRRGAQMAVWLEP